MRTVTLDITVETLGRLDYVRKWAPQLIAQMLQLKSLDIKFLTEMSLFSGDENEWRIWLEEQRNWWALEQTKSLKVFDAGTGGGRRVYSVLTGVREAKLAISYE